jgi:hypothetical protein
MPFVFKQQWHVPLVMLQKISKNSKVWKVILISLKMVISPEKPTANKASAPGDSLIPSFLCWKRPSRSVTRATSLIILTAVSVKDFEDDLPFTASSYRQIFCCSQLCILGWLQHSSHLQLFNVLQYFKMPEVFINKLRPSFLNS